MQNNTLDKRTAIIKAAMELIATNGFHGSPTSMIAAKAGVGTGTIYRYFSDKDQLIQEVFKDVEAHLNGLLIQGYPTGKSIRLRLDHYRILHRTARLSSCMSQRVQCIFINKNTL